MAFTAASLTSWLQVRIDWSFLRPASKGGLRNVLTWHSYLLTPQLSLQNVVFSTTISLIMLPTADDTTDTCWLHTKHTGFPFISVNKWEAVQTLHSVSTLLLFEKDILANKGVKVSREKVACTIISCIATICCSDWVVASFTLIKRVHLPPSLAQCAPPSWLTTLRTI